MFQCVVVFACALQDNKQSVFYAVTHHGGPPYSAMPKYAVAHTSDFKEVYVGVAVFQHCSFSRHDPLQLLTINDYYICTRTLLVRERIFQLEVLQNLPAKLNASQLGRVTAVQKASIQTSSEDEGRNPVIQVPAACPDSVQSLPNPGNYGLSQIEWSNCPSWEKL